MHASVLSISIGVLLLAGCSKTAYEKEHEAKLRAGPPDVTFRIEPYEDRTTLRAGEAFRFLETYEAKYQNQWHIEVMEGWNGAAISERAVISDGQKVWKVPYNGNSIICCGSRHVWLYLEKTTLPLWNDSGRVQVPRQLKLPEIPGKYQVYATSQRVFSSSYSLYTPTGLGTEVTSDNIVRVTVISRDAKWEADRLAWAIKTIDSRGRDAYVACAVLGGDLRNDAAVEEKIRRFAQNLPCGSSFALMNSDHPDRAFELLRKVVAEPNHPFEYNDIITLERLKVMRDKRMPATDLASVPREKWAEWKEAVRAAEASIKQDLLPSCSLKREDLRKACIEGLSH